MDSPFYYLFAVLLFLAVVLLVEGTYLWWNDSKGPEAKRIERRLRVMSAGGHEAGNRQSILKQRMLAESPWLQRRLLQLPRIQPIGPIARAVRQAMECRPVHRSLAGNGSARVRGRLHPVLAGRRDAGPLRLPLRWCRG